MRDVFIAGVAETAFGRLDASLAALAREAGRAALVDAGVEHVDHVLVGNQASEAFTGIGNVAGLVTSALGLVPAGASCVESGPASGASAVEAGVALVGSGLADTVLVVGVEKMTPLPTPRATRTLSAMLDPRERALGATMPAFGALAARAFMDRFDVSREDLALAPVAAHRAGARNPRAQFRNAVSVKDVLASPMVADPLRVFDCAPLGDGAAALVLTAAPGPVRVTGVGHATAAHAVSDRGPGDTLTHSSATATAASRAFRMAGRGPADVDVVEVHDAFSVLWFIGLESLGFFPPGGSVAALRAGDAGPDPDARLVVNPGGGLKARGHPVGASGVAQLVELHRQLTGRVDPERQARGARVGLAHSIGGFAQNVVVTLVEAAR